MDETTWPGREEPLGATAGADGVHFAAYSRSADRVEVCLFDPEDPAREIAQLPLEEKTARVWHGYVPGLKPGALYGFRACGPYDPAKSLRFNGNELLSRLHRS